jgi:hypothetical protein
MQTLELRLRFVRQTTGAGEYLVIYNAKVELNDQPGSINFTEVGLDDRDIPDARTVNITLEHIKLGMNSVLEPRGLGAQVRIDNLLIHPIDWRPERFEQHTRETLEKTLQEHKL